RRTRAVAGARGAVGALDARAGRDESARSDPRRYAPRGRVPRAGGRPRLARRRQAGRPPRARRQPTRRPPAHAGPPVRDGERTALRRRDDGPDVAHETGAATLLVRARRGRRRLAPGALGGTGARALRGP